MRSLVRWVVGLVVLGTVLIALAPAPSARANTTRTWTGAGGNGNWTNAANWGGTAPASGDRLTFPAFVARLETTNDFPSGTPFDEIQITGAGYLLGGNAVTLFSNLLVPAPNAGASVSLTLAGGGGITVSGGGRLTLSGANSFTGNVYVDNGSLRIQSETALGSTVGATSLATLATLEIDGSFPIAERLTFDAGGGPSSVN